MRASPYQLEGLLLFEPVLHSDERGAFFESFNAWEFIDHTETAALFVQDNHSISHKGVLRGLHYQVAPHAQGKLVRVVVGSAFDVAVDLRPDSETYGKWAGVELSAQNRLQLWIPPGFAHGFLALEDNTNFVYKTTDFWDRDSERAIRWDDPSLAIAWPVGDTPPLVSRKDAQAPTLALTQPPAGSNQTADAARH